MEGTLTLGIRRAASTTIPGGIRVAATEQYRCHGTQGSRRRGPAAIQNVRVGMVECERARLLDSRLREHRRRDHHGENFCRADELESGHSLIPPFIDPLQDLRFVKIRTHIQVCGAFRTTRIFLEPHSALSDAELAQGRSLISPRHYIGIWKLTSRLSTSADVQTLVELLIKLLLLGVECRQPLLFRLLRRSARRNLMRARLQMADRRWRHRCYRACEGGGIGCSPAEQNTADKEDCGSNTTTHPPPHPFFSPR